CSNALACRYRHADALFFVALALWVFVIFSRTDSGRIPSGFRADSQRIPGGFPTDSGQDSQRIPGGFQG
ncbi:MAG TPA: hypothetical protein P5032_13505, partial [Candidatus Competibacter sp.]|nr:hypothetical protein [Candidatus Competibacter sp.]